MISNELFLGALKENGIDFFCGIPDSLLKDFCAYLSNHTSSKEHIITANEGAAIALASGYHLATGKLPFVYLQNSGLGNTINPLLSLADPEVFSIPMIIMIGWRGEPGLADEPQHRKQGRVQNSMLSSMEVPYFTLDANTPNALGLISDAASKARKTSGPVAIVISKNTFEPFTISIESSTNYSISRESAITSILDKLSTDDIVVSNTGKASREVYEYRESKGHGHHNDFLTVGSMGHSSQIALGIALQSQRNVYCLDGDGSVIMHMGSLGIIGQHAPSNYKHIVLNNGAHDSVGGQPSVGFEISIPNVAKACGYNKVYSVSSFEQLDRYFGSFLKTPGPALIEVRIKKGARKDLGRPKSSPVENKMQLMKQLSSD